jgi:diguanylate cyclase (GGDEF)-like protein
VEELERQLAASRQRRDDEGRRSRLLVEVAGSIDVDEVMARTLEAAKGLTGADAALAMLADPSGGKPVVATLGLAVEEGERLAVTGTVGGVESPAIALSYTYTDREREESDSLVHGGVAVPLAAGDEPVGYLAVFTRSAGKRFGEAEKRELELLGGHAGPALENARRFREARRLADLDALTGLHNRRFFHETLGREVARAHRYSRSLALIVFDLDDFKEINDRIGHLTGDSVLAEVAERVRSVVRSADIACRVGGDEFAVILPEASLDDADQLYRRIQHAVSARPIVKAGQLRVSAGVAELQPEDDATQLFQHADDALYRAKNAGKGRVVAADSSNALG